jgi:flagellar biosynthesis/type III secretory pathway protein FliH
VLQVTLGLGRVIEAPEVVVSARTDDESTTRPRPAARALRLGRVVPPGVVDAAEQARDILKRAEHAAQAILTGAREEAAAGKARAADEGRAEAAADFAERSLARVAREREHDERALDRLVDLARVLAERLLGTTLELDPSRVAALARQALTEAQGARRIDIVAHPEDAVLLERELDLASVAEVTRIVPDATRTRGSLRFDTDLGTLDADLAPQLDRLAKKLRASIPHD